MNRVLVFWTPVKPKKKTEKIVKVENKYTKAQKLTLWGWSGEKFPCPHGQNILFRDKPTTMFIWYAKKVQYWSKSSCCFYYLMFDQGLKMKYDNSNNIKLQWCYSFFVYFISIATRVFLIKDRFLDCRHHTTQTQFHANLRMFVALAPNNFLDCWGDLKILFGISLKHSKRHPG